MATDSLSAWRDQLAVATAESSAYLRTVGGQLWTVALQPSDLRAETRVSAREVKELLLARQRQLKTTSAHTPYDRLFDLEGLLAYDPTQALSDGGAQEVTQGLVDVNSCPPWELWVGWVGGVEFESRRFPWFRSYLLAWIPMNLREQFGTAIHAESAMALVWWSDVNCRAYDGIRGDSGN